MKKILTLILSILVCTVLLTACSKEKPASTGGEADYPSKPITLLVGNAAGGSSDLCIRVLAPYLEKELGTSITIINKPGADGWVVWNDMLKAKPDGYTIAAINIPSFYNGYLDKRQNRKENLESFKFLANHVTDWGFLVVKKGAFADMDDFMQQAKTRELTVGDVSFGGNKHIQIEALKRENPAQQITSVHMNGWADTYAAMMGGHIDAVSATGADIGSLISEGEIEVLCIFAPQRSALFPEVSTCEELGYGPVYGFSSRGFMLPKGTSEEIFAKLDTAFGKAIKDPEQIEKLRELGVDIDYLAAPDYNRVLQENEKAYDTFADILGWNE